MWLKLSAVVLLLLCVWGADAKKPNIVAVITDDEDVVLGALRSQATVHKLLAEKGTFFRNAFVTTPVCCPSRASLLSGRYLHNTQVKNNSVLGGCKTKFHLEDKTAATYLGGSQSSGGLGYRTGFFGKYLNQYGLDAKTRDWEHIPPGWDRWYGLCGNSKYYDYAVSDQGRRVEHGHDPATDYFPHRVADEATKFIQAALDDKDRPFFAYITPPSPHRPATPYPPNAKRFSDKSAPRTPSFNVAARQHHWLVSEGWPRLNSSGVAEVDELFRDRWRTLIDIDEMVEKIVRQLESAGELENTYFLYASDHGYHLGEFQSHGEKRQPYETSIRIPLIIRGPGIPENAESKNIALSIDLVPTFLDMAGGYDEHTKNLFDGVSLLPSETDKKGNTVPGSSKRRKDFLIEYHGEHPIGQPHGCVEFGMGWLHDCWNNTFNALRSIDPETNGDHMLANFPLSLDGVPFNEFYDISTDPWELNNRYDKDDPVVKKLQARLDALRHCSGASCH